MPTFVDARRWRYAWPNKLYASTPTKIQSSSTRCHSKDLGRATIDVISLGALDHAAVKVPAVLTLTANDSVISIFLKLFPSAEITIER